MKDKKCGTVSANHVKKFQERKNNYSKANSLDTHGALEVTAANTSNTDWLTLRETFLERENA